MYLEYNQATDIKREAVCHQHANTKHKKISTVQLDKSQRTALFIVGHSCVDRTHAAIKH